MRYALAALVLVLSVNLVPAQTPNSAWAQKLFLGVSQHDFGVVPRGAQLKHKFAMKNIYAVPLEITEVRTTCSCLTPTPSTKKLAPQEEGYVEVLMDGRRFTGQKTITLFISVGPQFISTAAITVMANARSDVVFNPGEVNFGVVRQGQTPTQLIDVEYAGGLDWRILEVVKSASSPFAVVPRELYRYPQRLLQAGKVGYQLAVTLKSDAPAGPFQQELLLKTNDQASPVLTVVVEGTIQGNLTVAPNVVRLSQKVGQTSEPKILVRGQRPFRITGVDGMGNGVTVELPSGALMQHYVTIKVLSLAKGELRKELRIRTDMDGESAVVTVQATTID